MPARPAGFFSPDSFFKIYKQTGLTFSAGSVNYPLERLSAISNSLFPSSLQCLFQRRRQNGNPAEPAPRRRIRGGVRRFCPGTSPLFPYRFNKRMPRLPCSCSMRHTVIAAHQPEIRCSSGRLRRTPAPAPLFPCFPRTLSLLPLLSFAFRPLFRLSLPQSASEGS